VVTGKILLQDQERPGPLLLAGAPDLRSYTSWSGYRLEHEVDKQKVLSVQHVLYGISLDDRCVPVRTGTLERLEPRAEHPQRRV
jgi:hypothetical protein